MPRTLALVLWPVEMTVVFGVVPVALSALGDRHGWSGGRPGAANVIGVVPLALGAALIAWVLAGHYRAAPEGWQMQRGFGPAYQPEYLLRSGPYLFSRNPLYIGEDAVLAGWALLLGSIPVAVALVVVFLGQFTMVHLEERRLEAQFGEPYQTYRAEVPRWFRLTVPRRS
jgi:protein-S-isoprenylcysteine O-methyltransferase Ste14